MLGHSGGIQSEPWLMDYVFIRHNWKSTFFIEDFRGTSKPYWEMDWFWEAKEEDKARQEVFPTTTNPFGNDLEEEEPHDAVAVPQKVPW